MYVINESIISVHPTPRLSMTEQFSLLSHLRRLYRDIRVLLRLQLPFIEHLFADLRNRHLLQVEALRR
jgi:hypothetical protein